MRIVKKIRFMLSAAKKAGIIYNLFTQKEFESSRLLGEIVRHTHSIEKGLSLENVRLGFGYAKIKDAYSFIQRYGQLNRTIDVEQIRMFVGALSNYLEFHESKGAHNSVINDISTIYHKIKEKLPEPAEIYGGIQIIEKPSYDNNVRKQIQRVITERHSVREFDKTPVSESALKAAIELAMHCPSACNRQCYRVYIIDHKTFPLLDGWLEGVGGFADDLDKMLLITGRISDYRPTEQLQYIVSPAVFAGYLTITLQTYGIGCCFIQRPLLPDKNETAIARKLHISDDEQAVCVLGIGNLKDKYKVPVSHRLAYDKIVSRV